MYLIDCPCDLLLAIADANRTGNWCLERWKAIASTGGDKVIHGIKNVFYHHAVCKGFGQIWLYSLFLHFLLLFYFREFQYFAYISLTTCPNAVILVQPQSPIYICTFHIFERDVTSHLVSCHLCLFYPFLVTWCHVTCHTCHMTVTVTWSWVFP